MNLEDLRLFAAVVRAGSFAAASRDSGVPKATLSRRVAALEKALGVRLLHRSTRRLGLSEAGELLLSRAGPLLDDLLGVGAEVQSLQREPRGRLRVQMPLEFLNDDLADGLAEFVNTYQQLTVECAQYSGDLAAGIAAADHYDLTLLCYEMHLPASDWIARPLMSLRQGVFAIPELARRVGALADLSGLPAVTAVGEPVWHFRAGAETRAVAVSGTLALDSPAMRLEAAAHGAGLVKVPVALAERAVAAGRLMALGLPQQPVALSVAMLYRSRTMPARVRVFMDFLQSRLALRSPQRSG